ncbi:uncharacterized protein LOC123322641 [Coccinella septempunctata]|uniref:uncharacterized protein LOC123322641 n=1 Tax=Coccinella septempunctata TaxID=41139 RepID=UPI001D08EA97|nr:uncharacterized protein LOC123322641 [Coccinella septempunctata]
MHLLHCFNLIQQNYISNDSYLVLVNSDLNFDVPILRLNYKKPISTTNLFQRKFDFYLIDCKAVYFKSFTETISSQPFFSSASHFIFFCDDLKLETLLSLRRFEILNMIFLNTSSGDILSYFPYRKRMFQQFDTSLEVIGHCNRTESQPFVQLFPNKIPKKWTNTTLNIMHSFAPPYCMGVGDETGIELDTQVLILERLGMKANFTKVNIPEFGKRRLIMKILREDYCDFIIGVSSPTLYFESTMPYIYDDLMWYVPSAQVLSKWKFLIGVLNKFVWLWWTISSALAIVSLYINDLFLRGKWRPKFLLHKFCIFYRLFLEQAVSFRTKYLSELTLIVVLIFGTLMMNMIYKSRFFYFLTTIRFEDDLNSLEDIMDHGMTIGFLNWHRRLFHENKRLTSYLATHYQSCNMQANCSDQAAYDRNLAVLRPKIKMTYWTKRYLDQKGRPLLKRLEDPVADLFWVAAFFPGHPLFPSVNQYVLYLMQFGIMDKILAKYSDEVYKQDNLPETRRLTISHVQVPILIWAVGMIVGIMFLIVEIKWKYVKKRTEAIGSKLVFT